MRHPAHPDAGQGPTICYFSSSSSSNETKTTNTTEQSDERIAADGNAIVVRLANSELELTDPGVIEATGKTLESFERVLTGTYEFAKGQADQAFGLAATTLEKNRTETAQSLEQLIKAGVIVAAIGAAAFVAPKIFKG